MKRERSAKSEVLVMKNDETKQDVSTRIDGSYETKFVKDDEAKWDWWDDSAKLDIDTSYYLD